ncbi:MAG: D-alanine--D-alanine ligase [Opitutaceae bacterium]|nr:D-alanine--D-alanine ligase [Opitutaceae bacterium]
MHEDLVPPASLEGLTEKDIQPWKMEYDVSATLEQLGHKVHPLGIYGDLGDLADALDRVKPDIVFNMMEEFDGHGPYDQHLVSFLELRRVRYTGCNPRGLTLARDKALSIKILAYHRIPVPAFAVFKAGGKPRRPARLAFPLLVKSLYVEGSVGISRASVVRDEAALAERVELIHRQTGSPAIAEEYIEGREIYVGLMGNERLQASTPLELVLEHLPEGAPNIATSRLKWDYAHQAKMGMQTKPAELAPEARRHLEQLSKRIYRALCLSGYARLDFRLAADGRFFLLEANPNPCLTYGEDFAEAAHLSALEYPGLLDRILRLGLNYRGVW